MKICPAINKEIKYLKLNFCWENSVPIHLEARYDTTLKIILRDIDTKKVFKISVYGGMLYTFNMNR
jgi:hypothetical protein